MWGAGRHPLFPGGSLTDQRHPCPLQRALCVWRQKRAAISPLGHRGPLGLKPHTWDSERWPPRPAGHMAFPSRGPRQRSRAESPGVRVGLPPPLQQWYPPFSWGPGLGRGPGVHLPGLFFGLKADLCLPVTGRGPSSVASPRPREPIGSEGDPRLCWKPATCPCPPGLSKVLIAAF